MAQTRLFVGNLPHDVHENDLRSVFSNYGEVVNVDIKCKSNEENDPKKFAFVTISAGNTDVESCIKFFGGNDFKGSRMYVTRARESFLERLQREREQAEKKAENIEHSAASKKHPTLKLGDKLNPRKRKIDVTQSHQPFQPNRNIKVKEQFERNSSPQKTRNYSQSEKNISAADIKKVEADKKRLESMQKKRREFKNKQQIIKTGLIGIDKVVNKKTRFSDDEEDIKESTMKSHDTELKVIKRNTLFDDDNEESDGEVNFEIKKQFEGKEGQKVLDLQSRYKSDKRFVLDERFIEEAQEDENEEEQVDRDPTDQIEISQGDEKSKQFKILEDVLGVAIKTHVNKPDKDRKLKPNMGMIRFDPMNPEHAKFVVPVEVAKQETRKSKKSKVKQLAETSQPAPEAPKVEVSKEQFYKSEITKEAFLQPAAGFSLRSLFAKEDEDSSKEQEQENNYTPLATKKQQKVKNPLDPGEKNPFVYDSSESEDEGDASKNLPTTVPQEAAEVKAVWRENLFFSNDDSRLTDGLAFFNNSSSRGAPKERRELKSVMMKRIHNTERKNQMFKRKIGGRKKSMKKSYSKRS